MQSALFAEEFVAVHLHEEQTRCHAAAGPRFVNSMHLVRKCGAAAAKYPLAHDASWSDDHPCARTMRCKTSVLINVVDFDESAIQHGR